MESVQFKLTLCNKNLRSLEGATVGVKRQVPAQNRRTLTSRRPFSPPQLREKRPHLWALETGQAPTSTQEAAQSQTKPSRVRVLHPQSGAGPKGLELKTRGTMPGTGRGWQSWRTSSTGCFGCRWARAFWSCGPPAPTPSLVCSDGRQ